MSEKEIINDEMIFQSFSKNYVFDSNREPNKTSQNENIEFTFKKNLFIQKSEESPIKTNSNQNSNNNSPSNDKNMNIYSKNDSSLQESGHFGKSKHESNKYKKIIKENSLCNKQPKSFFNEKINPQPQKPNLNIKKLERVDSKFLKNKLKKSEIRKMKSGARLNSLNNNNKDTYVNNRNKKKKLKTESTYSLRVNHLSISDNNKRNMNNLNNEINTNIERRSFNYNYCKNDPVLNRIKKMKENNNLYKEITNNTFNKTNNTNYINSQIMERNEIKSIENSHHNFISINYCNNNNKIRKIPTGRYIDNQPKLKSNFDMNNTTKQISRNTRIFKENQENIPINMYNNTIIINSHKNPLYFNEIKQINSINHRPSCNINKMLKSKNRYDKRENMIQISAENYLKLKSEMHPNTKNNFSLSSMMNLTNLIKSNITPGINMNKNIDNFLFNKLNTIINDNNTFRIGKIIKKANIPKSNISKKKLMVKSFIMKNNFEF